MQEKIVALSYDDLKELMSRVVGYQPGLIMSLLEKGDGGGYHPDESSNKDTKWCICGHCRPMRLEEKRKCCRKSPQNCLSTVPVRILSHSVCKYCYLLMIWLIQASDKGIALFIGS